jgi:hypothetical protein
MVGDAAGNQRGINPPWQGCLDIGGSNPLGQFGELLLQAPEPRSEHAPEVTCDVVLTVAVRWSSPMIDSSPKKSPQLPDLLIVLNQPWPSLSSERRTRNRKRLPRERRAGVPLLDVEP